MKQAHRRRIHDHAGSLATCLIAIAACASPWPAGAQTNATSSAQTAAYASIVAIRLNGQAVSDSALVLRGHATSDLMLSEGAAKSLRLVLSSKTRSVKFDGETFHALDGVNGLTHEFDEATQVLTITAEATLFESASVKLQSAPVTPSSRPGMGVYFTYDLLSQYTEAIRPTTTTSAQGELGWFTPSGVLTHSLFATQSGGRWRSLRLDSTFTIDQPDKLASLRIGDAVTRSAGWGGNARFAGIQYATNFGTRPTFITYPLNTASGQTALPSTVDVYVNNILTGTQSVPAGPFTFNDLPAVNGQGEIRLVVRDLMGREQAILQPLYGSTALLRPGLNDFAVQAGRLRESYAIDSTRYGQGFAAGVWRRGVDDKLTLELGAETAAGHHSAGIGATWLLGALGQFSLAHAASRKTRPEEVVSPAAPSVVPSAANQTQLDGHFTSASWDRRSTTVSMGMQGRWASPDYRSVLLGNVRPSRREVSAYASYGAGGTSYSLGYVSVSRPLEPRIEFAQMTISRGLRDWGFLSLTGVASLSGERNHSVSLNYSLPLDFLTTVGASTNWTANGALTQREQRTTLQRSLPTGNGYGYRLDISNQKRIFADVRGQNRSGLYSLELSHLNGESAARVGASGSLTFLDGGWYTGRRVEDAFGVVQVPGFPGVRVYLDNQEIGRTDERGRLFVARLRPYQVNRLAIEQSDLPMSAEVMSLKLDASPFMKSGVVVRFGVRESRGGLAKLVDENGDDLPPGSVITNVATGEQHPVADGGMAFLTDLSANNRFRVSSQGKACTIEFGFQPSDDPQPRIGPFTCRLRP